MIITIPIPRSALLTGLFIMLQSLAVAHDRAATTAMLSQVESRVNAIYEAREFAPAKFSATWLRDSSGYLTLEPSMPNSQVELVQYNATSGKRSVLISQEQLLAPGTTHRLSIQAFVQSTVAGQFLVQAHNATVGTSDYWLCDSSNGNLKQIATDIGWLSWEHAFSPQGDRILFRQGPHLSVYSLVDGSTTQIATSAGEGVIDDQIRAKWSPNGDQVVYLQSNSTQVRQRPILHPTDPTYPEVTWERFARVGTPIPSLQLGVVSSQGGTTAWITLPAKPGSFYLNDANWAGNSSELLVEMSNRSRDHRKFLLINTQHGKATTAYEESDPAWVDSSLMANAGIEWIQNGQAFVLLSERDGWRHAYRISRDGTSQSLLTKHPSDIITRGTVDEQQGWFYYFASPNNATQRYLYRVRLDGTSPAERVTPADQPGSHSYIFSPDRQWAFHTYSTFDTPPVTDLVSVADHRSIRVLEDNAECRRRVAPLIARPVEFLELEIGNGVVMDAWMIKPREFDASKKYPVFIFIYGEPHSQTVIDDWASGQNNTLFHRMIADLGYLVVSIDGRGTPAPKGAAWRRAVYGSLGLLSTEEQAAGVQQLARIRPFVDASRVGIWGWSGGGSNTLNAMFRRPDVYHVGIAVAPKPRPELYNAWFQEIFMRTPEENPEGYRTAAAINYAEGLRGDLLIIHGTGETNTHIQITENLVDRLIELKKRFDYMAYPNRDHGLKEGLGTTPHLRLLITRYLLEHLPPGPR